MFAQVRQFAEQFDVPEQFVGMQFVDVRDGNLDHPAVGRQRQAERDFESSEDVLQVVDVDAERLAFGERVARIKLTAVGAGREVAKHGDPKLACRRLERRGGDRQIAEIDLVTHA